jgi:hypothetical protein
MNENIPKAPSRLGKSGSEFWTKTHAAYVLDDVQSEVLLRAAICLDRADAAGAILLKDGLTVKNRFGSTVQHPMVSVEQQSISLFRHLVRQLDIMEDN